MTTKQDSSDDLPLVDPFEALARDLECNPSPVDHASDCALHNAPALPPGPCTCGAVRVAR
jgi:hypothetical protein